MNSKEIIEQNLKYGARNYNPLPVVLCRGQGVFVWDVEGKRYFDMLSAYSAINQGHNHPKIMDAAIAQMKTLSLTSRAFFNDKLGHFVEKLCHITGMEKALPMNSGAEGVETAIKAMRKWGYEVKKVEPEKAEIIVCENNFHGRTTTIVGFSSDEGTYKNFGPATPGFKIIPYNNPEALKKAITPNTVGFLVEPIQGEAGVIIPDEDYLIKIRKITKENNVLLCLDEIQTGLARTGKLFCHEYSGIKPDFLIMGKALSGGFYPISAVAATDEVMNVFTPGTHGSTFGGNPLACAIGIAAIDVIFDENLVRKSYDNGKYFVDKLLQIKNSKIKEVRGKGLFMAIEFNEPIAHDVCLELMEQGILAKDTHDYTIRFAPPLVITKEQLDEAFEIIKDVIEKK